ncbi:hypothetical protein DVU_1564 [Nitratidesulfovibrio vulgaris str. Hildenborough]|uniref:Uncharacterized protein n=1 Tax=Nitratidesulfovibrio vulgaris (strain ATCC 29579 / DSM 644 / CCUG 34227 / NCIMB 8303 / VKM B-1760 / Hildenborough) TaxID=882 RepID=Q72BS0_NITV2|nr:hypothetical protein DVU_1564 [Nitratidesulfovibrio vulgaris str. Hildenborough]
MTDWEKGTYGSPYDLNPFPKRLQGKDAAARCFLQWQHRAPCLIVSLNPFSAGPTGSFSWRKTVISPGRSEILTGTTGKPQGNALWHCWRPMV